MRVLFRADASASVGTGHLMRSLALAQALRDAGDDVSLVTLAHSGSLADRWRSEGAVVIPAVDAGSDDDAAETRRLAAERAADWVVLDGYAFGPAYDAVSSEARLLLVDDFGNPQLEADAVVNGNLYAQPELYAAGDARLLLGPRYAMLRREFRAGREPVWREGIVISLGGADPLNHTVRLVEELAARGLRGRVVLGAEYRSAASTSAMARRLGWEPVERADDMSTLLGGAALAIVGAGTTTLECLATGTPMIAVPIADNQARVAAALAEQRLAVVADSGDPAATAADAAALLDDASRLAALGEAGLGLVDARGAVRVAGAMREPLITLRPAAADDAVAIYAWRNDPETRAASFNSEPIEWQDHLAWFDLALRDPRTRIFVAALSGEPVGTARLERRGELATISVMVAPAARSRGLASPIIRATVAFASELGARDVEAYIRPANAASLRAFEAAGFVVAPLAAEDAAEASAVRMTIAAARQG
jgi:UDP-2,4-diacetamido-2,4,6-trideoxy-beta-L-altropyranose hydrolase